MTNAAPLLIKLRICVYIRRLRLRKVLSLVPRAREIIS